MWEYALRPTCKMIVVAVTLLIGVASAAEMAPKAAEKPLLDNDRVKVFEKRYPPGSVSPMHNHPPRSIYFITDAHFVVTAPDGKTERRDFKAGTAAWGDDEMLAVTNAGKDEIRIIITYVK